MGLPDPNMNARLRAAILAARAENMPKDNIERAIKKASGGDAETYDEVRYEGYAPGGVAVIIEALTDNRNRTGSEVRHMFTRVGGNLGEPGSVAWVFEKKGVILVDAARASEDDLMVAIDAGAEDITMDDDVYEILCDPSDLSAVRAALDEAGVEVETSEISQLPKSRVPLDEDAATKLMKLIDALEEQDDVDAVHANFDVDADVLERVAG
jgi:YebC/PmpR family DNA-binding regulatory protein